MKIYVIENTVSGKCYVGITRRSLEARWAEHKEESNREKPRRAISMAIKKYGAESFLIKEVATADSWDSLCQAESELIKTLGTLSPRGYNMTSGGDGCPGLSVESLNKMKEKCRLFRHTKKTKELISKAGLGRKHTDEAKAKISAGHKGKKLTDEHRKKLSEAKKGKRMAERTEEHKRKISEGLRRAHARRKKENK